MPFFYCQACYDRHWTGQRDSKDRGLELWLVDGAAVAEHMNGYIQGIQRGQLSMDAQLRDNAQLREQSAIAENLIPDPDA